ncbi:MAG: hypothetical protein CFE32_03820, partial [Alphaproteobacteria bacterium PA3]
DFNPLTRCQLALSMLRIHPFLAATGTGFVTFGFKRLKNILHGSVPEKSHAVASAGGVETGLAGQSRADKFSQRQVLKGR